MYFVAGRHALREAVSKLVQVFAGIFNRTLAAFCCISHLRRG